MPIVSFFTAWVDPISNGRPVTSSNLPPSSSLPLLSHNSNPADFNVKCCRRRIQWIQDRRFLLFSFILSRLRVFATRLFPALPLKLAEDTWAAFLIATVGDDDEIEDVPTKTKTGVTVITPSTQSILRTKTTTWDQTLSRGPQSILAHQNFQPPFENSPTIHLTPKSILFFAPISISTQSSPRINKTRKFASCLMHIWELFDR